MTSKVRIFTFDRLECWTFLEKYSYPSYGLEKYKELPLKDHKTQPNIDISLEQDEGKFDVTILWQLFYLKVKITHYGHIQDG